MTVFRSIRQMLRTSHHFNQKTRDIAEVKHALTAVSLQPKIPPPQCVCIQILHGVLIGLEAEATVDRRHLLLTE